MLMEWMIHTALIDDLPYLVRSNVRLHSIRIHAKVVTIDKSSPHPHAQNQSSSRAGT